MNVLERWTEEQLTRVPAGPPAGELRRRVRVRRARRVGALSAAAIVFAILGVAAMLQSPTPHEVNVIAPAPEPTTTTAIPLATAAEFPPLARVVTNVLGNVKSNTDPNAAGTTPPSAEVVATTRGQVDVLDSVVTPNPQQPIYLVQVIGTFVCNECRGRVGAARKGTVIRLEYDQAGDVSGFTFGSSTAYDLSTLGTVYRLDLRPPLATTAEFPPLNKIIDSVSGSVTANTDPKAVVTTPVSAEIVATTRGRVFARFGGSPAKPADEPVYVVQVIGTFVCNSCSRPPGAGEIRGNALQVGFDTSGSGFTFGLSPTPMDLSTLGTVYRLPISG